MSSLWAFREICKQLDAAITVMNPEASSSSFAASWREGACLASQASEAVAGLHVKMWTVTCAKERVESPKAEPLLPCPSCEIDIGPRILKPGASVRVENRALRVVVGADDQFSLIRTCRSLANRAVLHTDFSKD